MNIHNLTNQEVEQLQMLLNKLTGKEEPQIATLEDMIDEIIEHFDFGKVQTAMAALDWKWGSTQGGPSLPTTKELKKAARERLEDAAKARLGDYESTYWEIPIVSSSGGFEARAWCNESKTQIVILDLAFKVATWDCSLEPAFIH